MINSVAASQAKDIKQAMLLGLGKAPLPGDADPLATLSLVAMRGKFMRTNPPTGAADASASYDTSAKYLSDESRLLLIKLLSDRDASAGDGIALGVLRAINARDLKLHPFDYARLEDFIAQHAANLGSEERAWLTFVRPARKQDDIYLDDPLTEETLPQASRAHKLQFLRVLRKGDAAKARELVGALLPNEPANVRAELVSLLAVTLDDADRPFLESLSQDRAQSVRDAASMLLGCIRGTDAFAKRIERLKDHLQIKTEGLLRKHRVLKYTGLAAGKADEAAEAQRALLRGLRLKDVAGALSVTEQDLLEAASRSQNIGIVPLLLLSHAVKDGLLELAAKHTALLDGQDESFMAELLAETLPSAPAGYRDQILRLAIRPKSWTSTPSPNAINQIWELIRAPLPTDLASEFLDSSVWADGALEPTMNAAAPLIPRALSEHAVAKSETVARRATLYHRFLLSLPEHETRGA
jgi:hypothetical protein